MKAPKSYAVWLQRLRGLEAKAEADMKAAAPEQFEAAREWWTQCRIDLQDMESDPQGFTAWCLAANNPIITQPLAKFRQ